jgi:hypothetical protein
MEHHNVVQGAASIRDRVADVIAGLLSDERQIVCVQEGLHALTRDDGVEDRTADGTGAEEETDGDYTQETDDGRRPTKAYCAPTCSHGVPLFGYGIEAARGSVPPPADLLPG